jgi:hypothetical protein
MLKKFITKSIQPIATLWLIFSLSPYCKYLLSFYCAALTAFSGAAEKFGSAIITGKKFFFAFNKRLRTQLFPEWNSTQNIFLALRHREIIDFITREISAMMAAGISLFPGTAFNRANLTIPVNRIREAALAINFVGSVAIGFGQFFF